MTVLTLTVLFNDEYTAEILAFYINSVYNKMTLEHLFRKKDVIETAVYAFSCAIVHLLQLDEEHEM